MQNLRNNLKKIFMSHKRLGKAAVNQLHEASVVLHSTDGLEAFEIAIGVGIAVVLGVIILSNNKTLISTTIWPKVTSNATSLFS